VPQAHLTGTSDRLTGPSDAGLARTIIQLGQSLGMATIAEGIEQYSQFLALRRMTCELGQGYYFSRPLPADEAARLLADAGELSSGRPSVLSA
jgi:EAL domain-containing protein (putative c-di-GMP-specific phosphodiesterase class I)